MGRTGSLYILPTLMLAMLSGCFFFSPPESPPPSKETEADTPQAEAVEGETPEVSPDQPPESGTILAKAASVIGSGEPVAFDFHTTITLIDSVAPRESHIQGQIALGKGSQGILQMKDERIELKIYNDDNSCIKYFPTKNQYLKLPPAVSRRNLILTGMSGILEVPFLWIADLLEGKTPLDTPAEMVSEEYNGTACWKISADTPRCHLEVYLSANEPCTPVALTMKLNEAELEKQRIPKTISLTLATEFQNWQAPYTVPANGFSFTPPPDAVEMQLEQSVSRVPIKEGSSAPDFTLDQIQGEPVNLKDYLGKNIIILDFWATWCGPCRRVIPLVTEVSKEFADRGVILFAVNQRETPEKVQSFLQNQNLSINVLLDRAGQAGNLYQVSGIPKVIIIGKDGLIKKIYAGMSGNLKNSMTTEIEKLLE